MHLYMCHFLELFDVRLAFNLEIGTPVTGECSHQLWFLIRFFCFFLTCDRARTGESDRRTGKMFSGTDGRIIISRKTETRRMQVASFPCHIAVSHLVTQLLTLYARMLRTIACFDLRLTTKLFAHLPSTYAMR